MSSYNNFNYRMFYLCITPDRRADDSYGLLSNRIKLLVGPVVFLKLKIETINNKNFRKTKLYLKSSIKSYLNSYFNN